MGAVFTFVFAIIIIAIGVIPFIVGIVTLAVRGFKRRKNPDKKYRGMKVCGIILTVIGVLVAGVPLLLMTLILGGGILSFVYDEIEARFWEKHVDTGVVIEADYDELYENGFYFEGKHYTEVVPMQLVSWDKNRGEAVANLKEGDDTVFVYEDSSDCDLLCVQKEIFCSDKDREKLAQYYQQEEFIYHIYDYGDDSVDKKIDFSPEMYFDLSEMNEDIVQKVENENNVWDSMLSFNLHQYNKSTTIWRTIDIYISPEQEVFIEEATPLFWKEEVDYDTKYQVIDEEAAKELIQIGEQVKALKKD